MRPLEVDDLVSLDAYASRRPEYRRVVIAHKKERRMAVGDRVTLVFEDRETLRFQVQEMLHVERIADPERIQYELDVYNELMPAEGELSATLFIEITDLADIRPELDRMIGLDEHVSLRIGTQAGDDVAAGFDPKQLEEDRLSAVQYIRFRMDEAQCACFADPTVPVSVRIDHPAYAVSVEIPPAVRASLAAGLRQEPAPLITPGAPPPAARVLFETGRVRAVESVSGARVVVEALDGEALDEALWTELALAVRRAAASLAERRGRVRIQADWTPDGPAPRWHVVALEEGA